MEASQRFSVVVQTGHICRGFPFRVTGSVMPADRSVGIMSRYLDDLDITTLSGSGIGFLKLTEEELAEIEVEVWEEFRKGDRDV